MALLYAEVKASDKKRASSIASNGEITVIFSLRNGQEYEVIYNVQGITVIADGGILLQTGTQHSAQ